MTPRKALASLERSIDQLVARLDEFTEEQFLGSPQEQDWSLAQVYEHLITGAEEFQIRNLEVCLMGSPAGKKNLTGHLVMLLGGFPPTNIKVASSPTYTPKPTTRELARTGLQRVRLHMQELLPRVEASSRRNTSPHRAFGSLNAREWYALVAMHFHHHASCQVRRIAGEIRAAA